MIDYLEEVIKYGKSLNTEEEKEVARQLFNDLISYGYNAKFIYFCIQKLGNRKLIDNRNLFFYKPFQEEVEENIRAYDYKQEQKQKEIEEIGKGILEQLGAEPIKIKVKIDYEADKKVRLKYRGYIDLDSIEIDS